MAANLTIWGAEAKEAMRMYVHIVHLIINWFFDSLLQLMS